MAAIWVPQRRTEIGLVDCKRLNGGHQFLPGVGFQDAAACAGTDQLVDHRFVAVHGQDENFRFRQLLQDLPRGLEAGRGRHAIVKDRYVGHRLQGLLDGRLTVTDLGNDLPARVALDDLAKSGADDLMIIRYQKCGSFLDTPAIAMTPSTSG